MQTGDFLVEVLRQHVDAEGVVLPPLVQFQLREHLVRKARTHHETGMAGRVPEVEQPSFREHQDLPPVGEDPGVHLGLDVLAPDTRFRGRIREICDRYEVLLVSDEVITGFGRTGTMFGLTHWGIEPDIMQFAKGITSGYIPLGGIGLSDRVAATLDSADQVWMHAYTYSAHPVCCAVALENLRIIREEGLVEMAAEKGAALIRNLEQAVGGHPHVGEVRGQGLIAGVEVVADRETRELFPASEKVGPRLLKVIDDHGVFSRVRGDVFVCAPPVCSTSADLEQIADAVAAALAEVLG